MRRASALSATVAALTLVLAACGGSGQGSADTTADGRPRTIEVTALDSLRFDPDAVTVRVGETVRFVVTNAGHTVHDFFVGTEQEQQEHAREMAEMGGMGHGDADALTIEPGETGEITLTFDEPGAVLYGCHQPGHYEGGMVGTITVS